jgi:cell division protein ZapE
MGVREVFDAHLAARGYRADASQLAALARLRRLDEDWRAYKAQRSNALKKLLARPPVPRGVYLCGCTSTNSCAACIANSTK